MHSFQILFLLGLAISVLVTYYIFLIKNSHYSYLEHPYWFKIPKNVISILIFFQIFAMIGFIVSIGSWLVNTPKKGIMSGNNLFLTLVIFFVSAILWPISTYYECGWLVVLNLILTAIASILLLAGSIEEENIKTYRVLGLLCLCITTVLGDGVIWNANYIIKNKELFIN